MANIRNRDDHLQIGIPLTVKPVESYTSTVTSLNPGGGTLLYGHYSMDYRIPGGILRILARHDNKAMQILLLTEDTELLRKLPGERPSSLIADTISRLNEYLLRSDCYERPLSIHQKKKIELAHNSIRALTLLLEEERQIGSDQWSKQENLRIKVIDIIESCRDENILLANHPCVSEGALGKILYETRQSAQHYEFNRVFPVSRIDQHDFSQFSGQADSRPCYVWDSEILVNEKQALEALWVISKEYGFNEANDLNRIDANRFKRLEIFFKRQWLEARKWVDYLAMPVKPEPKVREEKRLNGLSITQIDPYYFLEGIKQKSRPDIYSLVRDIVEDPQEIGERDTFEEAEKLLWTRCDGSWIHLPHKNTIVLRNNNRIQQWHYFKENDAYYLLPKNEDLLTITQLSKRHLYFLEKAKLKFKAFLVGVPRFFKILYQQLRSYITDTLKNDFSEHLHAGHQRPQKASPPPPPVKVLPSHLRCLEEVLQGQGLLANGETLEQFIKRQLHNNQYVIVRPEHLPSPPAYTNPFHRVVSVLRHFSALFIDISEQNPIIGSLAIAAYMYGAGAVAAPEMLKSILVKLHLNGLIHGIEPTQALGRWMSHGTVSEAISAAVTYWQGVIVGGDLDQFFIKAISVLRDEPAQVAIIISLALGLGYGLCKAFPSINKEMGTCPWPNRFALGIKGGGAAWDTVMHPGDDWLLGTIKWLLHGGMILLKTFISPFIEWHYYGFQKGFGSGLKKSVVLSLQTGKEILAGTVDLTLSLLTVPFMELSAMFIHVPFRGITSLFSKTFGALGNIQAIGEMMNHFALRKTGWDYLSDFRLSPLYGFSNPIQTYSFKPVPNALATLFFIIVSPLLQLIKNVIILPILDLSSLILRLTINVLDLASRMVAFVIGNSLFYAGYVSDYTLGYLFRFTATLITRSSNWVDKAAGFCRQLILKEIQLGRHIVFHWAFGSQDASSHQTQTDLGYFQDDLLRLDRLEEQDSTQRLLEMLIDDLPDTSLSELNDNTICNRLSNKPAASIKFEYETQPIGCSDYPQATPVF